MTTINDQIIGALRLIGVLAEGEFPSPETAQDALTAFNQMLDSWSLERLAIYAMQDQVFNWLPGVQTATLGPTGDFVGVRPIKLDMSTYYRVPNSNLTFVPLIINVEQYNNIIVKDLNTNYPQVLYPNMTNPNIEMSLWPIPDSILEFHFLSVEALAQASSLTTVLAFPPGYLRAFSFGLACEIATMFGISAPPDVARIAKLAKRNIKRINNPRNLASMPKNILNYHGWGYNIYTGGY